jgi:hypothetical protein
MRLSVCLGLCFTTILIEGCASDYSPRADLSSYRTIGVIVPPGSSEPHGAGDVLNLNNRTVVEDRVKNSAVGAGTGAAAGTAIGIGTAALTGCALTGPLAPLCWIVFAGGGAVLGGGTGAVAGAFVDTQEKVAAAPVHRYEVNHVLPTLQREYLSNTDLQQRALRLVRLRVPTTNFISAEPDGDRYRLVAQESTGAAYSDVTLVLSDFRVELEGKAENDPKVALSIYAQWSLRKYDPVTNLNPDWDVLEGKYQSKKYELSEWLADDGALLKSHLDDGLESSFNSAFAALASEKKNKSGRTYHKRALSDDFALMVSSLRISNETQ